MDGATRATWVDMLGVSIGNYKIIEKVAEGGMGAVYRAVHETLGRCVAVKMLLPTGSSNREMVARLLNEARSAAAIRHPGVVEIYDFGILPDHTAYIMMEFLEGESLAARLRRERDVPYAWALDIARAVARTLHAAHERGIVHRDLKPDNIFVVPDPESATGERVKLLDFGIAKPEAERSEYALTETGMMVGTPPYMSPEQCRGQGPVDRRADLYALGCVLYELVCGLPPFIAGGAGDIIAHHLYFAPDPPRRHAAPVPQALETLILWLLQKDPRHRPATAAHVVAAIDDLEPDAASAGSPVRTTAPLVASPIDALPTVTEAAVTVRTERSWVGDHWSRTGRRSWRRGGT